MPAGSINVSLGDLQAALAGIARLLGEPGANGAAGSGLAGAAELVARTPVERVQGFADQLSGELAGMLAFDPEEPIAAAVGVLGALRTQAVASPTAALAGFAGRLSDAGQVLDGDLLGGLQGHVDAVRRISEGMPPDRAAIASVLLDQILGVLGSMQGPEGDQIRAWAQSIDELQQVLTPIIDEVRVGADAGALAVAVVQRALDSTLEVFGFEPVRRLVEFLDGFPATALPPATLDPAVANLTAVVTAYGGTIALADADFPTFRGQAVAATEALEELKLALRPVMGVIRRVARLPLFQPNALEAFLRAEMAAALAVKVNEVQKIDDPFNALFDRIDGAIDGIDLSAVRTEMLGFFETTRETIEQVDIPSITDTLTRQLAPVRSTVADLERAVTDLGGQLEGFFDELGGTVRSSAERVGSFQSDGSFRFRVEDDLRGIFAAASRAIGGDPDAPDPSSLTARLGEIQDTIKRFLGELQAVLAPVQAGIVEVRDTAVGGIADFTAFIEGLDVPGLIGQLEQQVAGILEELGPIDFALVVDPVVAELDENAAKLRDIDPDALNDLLRGALAVALDVVIRIDFTAEISGPLKGQFAEIKAAPAAALAELQRRYEEALSMLDALSPEQLLAALFAAFDALERAVAELDAAALIRPLDEAHERHLVAPLGALRPSVVLQPVVAAQAEALSIFDGIDGAALVGPLTAGLDELKGRVAALDVTAWADDLLAAVEGVKADLRAVRPSEVLAPLVADFERLERELDRFKPSVLFAPAVALAAPLLEMLEDIQQATIAALHAAFEAPLRALDRLRPEALTAEIQAKIDELIALLDALRLPARYNQLKGSFADLKLAVQADEVRLSLTTNLLDPEQHLGDLVAAYNEILAALEGLKSNVALPDLAPLYAELRERLLSLLPPYARELLDAETFRRVMRLADPTRFLGELDVRFDALKAKLLPIRPQDIVAEIDASYAAVLALVEGLDLEAGINEVRAIVEQIKATVGAIRIDFLAADIDAAVADLRALVGALDIGRVLADLDQLHAELAQVIANTRPSALLAELPPALDQVKATVRAVDPRTGLAPPLTDAWNAVETALGEIDFTVILRPLVAKLDELEMAFEAALGRTETAFDAMLGAARHSLSGGVGISV